MSDEEKLSGRYYAGAYSDDRTEPQKRRIRANMTCMTSCARHVGVDTLGLPHIIALTAADVTDYLDLLKEVMTNGGYTGEKFAEAVKSVRDTILVSVEICRL